MKLFVWENPYKVSYGHSMVFAIAPNLRAARRIALRAKTYSFGIETRKLPPDIKLAKPTRIVSLPCAEWHKWEE